MMQGRFEGIGLSKILTIAGVLIASCLGPEPDKYICILNCNPGECLLLDEENCECVSDLDCVTEKFCGGDVAECGCREEDGGDWCTALTGDSIKTWKFAYVYDSWNKDTITSPWSFYYDDLNALSYIYRLDNIYIESLEFEDPFIYSWKFDDVNQPTKIIYRRFDHSSSDERDLIKLTADSLILDYREDGIFGQIVYVPEPS